MAKIKFNRKEFEKQVKLTKEVEEKINMLGTHLESLTEDEIELEILPNRPDLLSMQGFLRALKAFLGKDPGLKEYKLKKPEKDYKVTIDSSLKEIRPYTVCAIVRKIKFDDSKIKEMIDLQEKLHATIGRNRKKIAIGIYPLEKITLPIKFEARKPQDIKFMPLEAKEEMTGLQILQRHPTGRDYAHLLTNFDKFPVFVDAKNKILSMPPIINSHETGKVLESTNSVFVECSGSDFNTLKKTLNIIVTAFLDMGAEVYQMELSYKDRKEITPNLSPESMKINLDYINKILGLNLTDKDLQKLLPKMGYDYLNGKVSIPAWRSDILHEADIAEDIAIAYGYENFIPEIPKVSTIGLESKESKLKSKISEILIGLGLIETSSLHLIKNEEIRNPSDYIEVQDSKTEYKILRPNLLIPTLRILSENKNNEYPQKIFEIGPIFSKDVKEETGINENNHLMIALTPGNFSEIKSILDHLTKSLNLTYQLKESIKENLIEGRTGTIIINGKDSGSIGEVHPETLKSWNLSLPLSIIELNLNSIFSQ